MRHRRLSENVIFRQPLFMIWQIQKSTEALVICRVFGYNDFTYMSEDTIRQLFIVPKACEDILYMEGKNAVRLFDHR